MKEGLKWGITEADITGKVDVFAFGLVIMYMYKRYHLLQKWITQGQTTYKNYEDGIRMLLQQNLMIQVKCKIFIFMSCILSLKGHTVLQC